MVSSSSSSVSHSSPLEGPRTNVATTTTLSRDTTTAWTPQTPPPQSRRILQEQQPPPPPPQLPKTPKPPKPFHALKLNPASRKQRARKLDFLSSVAFLHVGKAGGGTVQKRMIHLGYNTYYEHPNPQPLELAAGRPPSQNSPQQQQKLAQYRRKVQTYLVNIRDPIDRFVSNFYWSGLIFCYYPSPEMQQNNTTELVETRIPSSLHKVGREPSKYCRVPPADPNNYQVAVIHDTYQGQPEHLALAFCRPPHHINSTPNLKSNSNASEDDPWQDMQHLTHAKHSLSDWFSSVGNVDEMLRPSPPHPEAHERHNNNTSKSSPLHPKFVGIVLEKGYDLNAQIDAATAYVVARQQQYEHQQNQNNNNAKAKANAKATARRRRTNSAGGGHDRLRTRRRLKKQDDVTVDDDEDDYEDDDDDDDVNDDDDVHVDTDEDDDIGSTAVYYNIVQPKAEAWDQKEQERALQKEKKQEEEERKSILNNTNTSSSSPLNTTDTSTPQFNSAAHSSEISHEHLSTLPHWIVHMEQQRALVASSLSEEAACCLATTYYKDDYTNFFTLITVPSSSRSRSSSSSRNTATEDTGSLPTGTQTRITTPLGEAVCYGPMQNSCREALVAIATRHAARNCDQFHHSNAHSNSKYADEAHAQSTSVSAAASVSSLLSSTSSNSKNGRNAILKNRDPHAASVAHTEQDIVPKQQQGFYDNKNNTNNNSNGIDVETVTVVDKAMMFYAEEEAYTTHNSSHTMALHWMIWICWCTVMAFGWLVYRNRRRRRR